GVSASAQDMNSKKGTAILPESGDWSIGISANSFLNYAGNLMNGSNSAPSFDWANGQVITGKMMKDANTAYRAQIRIGLNSSTLTNPLADFDGDGIVDGIDSTEYKTSSTNITLGAGIQKYRGKGRLQGIYGAEAAISLGGSKMTANATDASGIEEEMKDGSTFGIGVRGFIGAEYFFAPKMSLSGEFGWGISLNSQGEGEYTYSGGGQSTTTKYGKASAFGIDTDNVGGNINLNFYF
ncbi:MAG: hypothetical protein RLZZ630_1015, partial [Bacteroidota bacterium]